MNNPKHKLVVNYQFAPGETFGPNDDGVWEAGIDVDGFTGETSISEGAVSAKWGNRIDVYGKTKEGAESLRDHLLGLITCGNMPSPTQPQSSLYELADKWREDRKQYCDVGTRQVYECLADELQAALAAESELRGWQPIETAPKDGTEILVYEDGSIFKAAWEDECEAWIAFCGQPVVRTPEPTLWSRLSPPTNETLVRLREDG